MPEIIWSDGSDNSGLLDADLRYRARRTFNSFCSAIDASYLMTLRMANPETVLAAMYEVVITHDQIVEIEKAEGEK